MGSGLLEKINHRERHNALLVVPFFGTCITERHIISPEFHSGISLGLYTTIEATEFSNLFEN